MATSNKAKILVIVCISLLAGIYTTYRAHKSTTTAIDAPTTTPRTVEENILVREDSWQIKAKDSKVTIVQFIDLESGSCRSVFPTVQRLTKDYEGKINFVIRYFPSGNNSVLAAKAAESAGEQGKYWEMLGILFGKQLEWYQKQEPQTEIFIRYAKELNLDIEKFQKGLENKKYEDKIMRDKNDGLTAKVDEVPLFFFNGKLAGNVLSYDELKSIIDPELSKNK